MNFDHIHVCTLRKQNTSFESHNRQGFRWSKQLFKYTQTSVKIDVIFRIAAFEVSQVVKEPGT